MDRATATREKPLHISQLTSQIKGVLERQFQRLWVVGEISNFKRAGSGHWYFSLKDANAQIRCNMWRSYTHNVGFQPKDGTEVLVTGSLNVYQPRGEYSLIVEHIEERGVGRLKMEFERLKAKLQQEGLFDPAHKKPLPYLPRKIGIVTSPTGAALRDILHVLRGRFAGVDLLIYPARVQGSGAADEIAQGIDILDLQGACDVILIGRGGGSEEDLWCFNEEVVARSIFAAETPILSAVGHETDFTIADFVADVRAATPSNGAELAIRSRVEYQQRVGLLLKSMERAVQRRLLVYRNRINLSESHPIFVRVRSRLNDAQRHLADLDVRMQRRLTQLLQQRERRLARVAEAFNLEKLRSQIGLLAQRTHEAQRELGRKTATRLDLTRTRWATLVNRLEDLSPLKVLARGYAAVFDRHKRVVKKPEDVKIGEVLDIKLAQGTLQARVVEKAARAVQPELFP